MIKTGNLKIEGSLALAPMAGYTDSPYRRIARKYGAAFTVTELISAEGVVRMNRKTRELLLFSEAERPIGIQLFGSKPGVMAEAAKKCAELSPDFIDINMGCSVRRVLRGGSGAGLLDDPVLLGKVASGIVKSTSLPVSAKIRIGTEADNRNYLETLNILQDSGIAFVAVHGRTRSQAFRGEADWDAIAEIKAKSSIPVIGNGDIKTHEEAMSRLASSGCDAVMIGRAAVGNPWIFNGQTSDIRAISELFKEHLDLMLEFYGDSGIKLFRKHIVKYIRGMRDSAKLRALLVNANTKEEIEEHINKLAG